jgi:hypothetical protein
MLPDERVIDGSYCVVLPSSFEVVIGLAVNLEELVVVF